jgi:SnoaL-like polyketide cyclase
MSKEQDNKAIVGHWFKELWGNPWNPKVVDELATPDILLQYSLHAPRRGRADVKDFMSGFREAFPDLEFHGAADLIAEGDFVVGRWEGGGRHAHRARLQRFSRWLASGPFRSKDALHGNNGAADREWQDRRGDRTRRRRDGAAAAGTPARSLIERDGTMSRPSAMRPGRLVTRARSFHFRHSFQGCRTMRPTRSSPSSSMACACAACASGSTAWIGMVMRPVSSSSATTR